MGFGLIPERYTRIFILPLIRMAMLDAGHHGVIEINWVRKMKSIHDVGSCPILITPQRIPREWIVIFLPEHQAASEVVLQPRPVDRGNVRLTVNEKHVISLTPPSC